MPTAHTVVERIWTAVAGYERRLPDVASAESRLLAQEGCRRYRYLYAIIRLIRLSTTELPQLAECFVVPTAIAAV